MTQTRRESKTVVMTNQELITRFEGGSIPENDFHHVDHVRLAFAYLCGYPVLQALQRFCASLRQFAKAQGKENRYHETITWAYLLLIHERRARSAQPQTWEQFASANPDLLTWKNGILKRYYAEETLQSDVARKAFVFPDRCA